MPEIYEEILDDLKIKGISGSAIIDKEGDIIETDLPEVVHEETFSIMCATVFGASTNANSELDRTSVNRIIVESNEGKIIITSVQQDRLLAVVVGDSEKLGVLFDEIKKAVKKIKQIS